ncbi:MAG: TaqI-like C-terminal specificity domain-containing protein [Synergistaceae bacterium]|nr:TaqI-like C-terminal specificity domain-containing protein [Synergistaceae bacterium]
MELINEDPRSEEIIRPILRGRDIKRYGYEFADLWLIATFPAKHYDIDKYPAIKKHLLSFGKKRLAQTGEKNIDGIDGNDARKKTSNKWFETQDSISYWDDFSKPKIMYPNMTKYLPFYYDTNGFFQNDKSFMITGACIAYLTTFLNSSLFKFCFLDNFPELLGDTRELRKIFFDKIPVKKITLDQNKQFEAVVNDIQREYSEQKAILIDSMIFDIYGLTQKEREQIGYIKIL